MCDALNKILWRDDSQVDAARVTMHRRSKRPRLEAWIIAINTERGSAD